MQNIEDIEKELFGQKKLVKTDPRMVPPAKEIINAYKKLINRPARGFKSGKL